jgi:hypothetical protein
LIDQNVVGEGKRMAASQPYSKQAAQKQRNIQRIQQIKIMLAQKRAEKAERDERIQEHP